jgi:hypothetical protein
MSACMKVHIHMPHAYQRCIHTWCFTINQEPKPTNTVHIWVYETNHFAGLYQNTCRFPRLYAPNQNRKSAPHIRSRAFTRENVINTIYSLRAYKFPRLYLRKKVIHSLHTCTFPRLHARERNNNVNHCAHTGSRAYTCMAGGRHPGIYASKKGTRGQYTTCQRLLNGSNCR